LARVGVVEVHKGEGHQIEGILEEDLCEVIESEEILSLSQDWILSTAHSGISNRWSYLIVKVSMMLLMSKTPTVTAANINRLLSVLSKLSIK
jgi:hypothetical protein